MNARMRSWILRLGCLAFAAAMLFWLQYVPPDPWRPYRVVPIIADFVSAHDRPAARMDDLLDSPLAAVVAQALRLPSDDRPSWRDDPAVRRWTRRLADRQVVIASYRATGDRRIWMLASRLEGRAWRLRWMLKLGALPDFRRIGHHQGRVLWMLKPSQTESPYRLVIAFEEGLLVGCWSEQPGDIRTLLDTYDRSIPSFLAGGIPERFESERGAPDVFWWKPPTPRFTGHVCGEFSRIAASGVTARMTWKGGAAVLAPPDSIDWRRTDPQTLFGSDPSVALQMDPTWAAELLRRAGTPPAVIGPLQALSSEMAPPLVAAIFDGEYSGRLWRMRVPTLVLASPLREPSFAARRFQSHLDRINRLYRTSLLLGPVAGAPGLYTIGLADGSFYATLSAEEQAAVYFTDGWGIAASNLDALRRVAAGFRPPDPKGRVDEDEDGKAALYGSVDVPRAAAALRSGLSVAALAMMMQDREGTRAARTRINRLRDGLAITSAIGRTEAALRWNEEGDPEIEFHLRAAEPVAHGSSSASP